MMAREIKTIHNGMKVEFVRNDVLRTNFGIDDDISGMDENALVACYDSHISVVSVVNSLMFVVATCCALVENMMDWFREDVNRIISGERYGHAGWFEQKAKHFQYAENTDFGLNEQTGMYATEDETYRIIRHASCRDNGFGVLLKVAKGEVGALSPLNDDEKTAFVSYINRLKPAGVPVTVVTQSADLLKLKMAVYYNPTIYTEVGATAKVKEVVTNYLTDIDFNGEFVTMTMVDHLQQISGIDIVEVDEVYAQYAGNAFERIEYDSVYTPKAGYMKLANDSELELTMIAHV